MGRVHVLAVFVASAIVLVSGASWSLAAPPVMPGQASGGAWVVHIQAGPGNAVNAQRDCQTLRQCRYTRGGIYRGCISTYSCRVCRFVAARCTITGRDRICRELRCSWGA